MRKDLRDIFDQVRAANHKSEYKKSEKSEDITVQNNTTLSIPRTISEQTQSKLVLTYLVKKKKNQY